MLKVVTNYHKMSLEEILLFLSKDMIVELESEVDTYRWVNGKNLSSTELLEEIKQFTPTGKAFITKYLNGINNHRKALLKNKNSLK